MPSVSAEHYLKAIYKLEGKGPPVSLSRLSRELAITLPSASEMVRKLAKRGLVDYQRYRGVALTPAGRAEALAVTRRHRSSRTFSGSSGMRCTRRRAAWNTPPRV